MINFVTFSKIHKQKKNLSFPLFSLSKHTRVESTQAILLEKRKRNQAYFTLDYLLSRITYFDFFSVDAFTICKYAKYLAQYVNQTVVTPELLLLACFYCDSSLADLLAPYEFEEIFETIVGRKQEENKEKSLFLKFSLFLASFQEEPLVPNENIPYSHQVNQLFLKAAESALIQFKNPVITSEILFLTLMNEKKYASSKLIKKILGNKTDWYLMRYQLIKNLHKQESTIRAKVSKNQQYFAYLLKTQIPERTFNFFIQKESLGEAVLDFRNLLVTETMQMNLLKNVFQEVKKSMELGNSRVYSS